MGELARVWVVVILVSIAAIWFGSWYSAQVEIVREWEETGSVVEKNFSPPTTKKEYRHNPAFKNPALKHQMVTKKIPARWSLTIYGLSVPAFESSVSESVWVSAREGTLVCLVIGEQANGRVVVLDYSIGGCK